MTAGNGLQKITSIMLIIMGVFIFVYALIAGKPIFVRVLSALITIMGGLRGEPLYGQIIIWVLTFFMSLIRILFVAMSMMAFFFAVLGAGLALTAGIISNSCYSNKVLELVLGSISILTLPASVVCMTMINSRYTLDALDSLVFIPYLSIMDVLIIISVIVPILFLIGTVTRPETVRLK